jgi:HD superfamily phosphohydrolase
LGCYQVINTETFQRLRRIKQLGFSDFVYPGATHTRFSHSLGVYHLAQKLADIIRKTASRPNDVAINHAIVAALVHDIGHGPFSHAFEEVGKKLDIPMARHEDVGDAIIRNHDIGRILDDEFSSGFSTNVADMIKGPGPTRMYGAIVSSQFDADRLDYMQRDRFMTGTQIGTTDFSWLLANLEIGELPWGDEKQEMGKIQTFVLGPKALHAAESYVLSLFQLYPTVYFHKTTRGIEKLFTSLMIRLFSLVKDNSFSKINLSKKHPIICFAKNSESLENVLKLDDMVVMGAIQLLIDSKDKIISDLASCIYGRKIYKCIDIYEKVKKPDRGTSPSGIELKERLKEKLKELSLRYNKEAAPRILIDEDVRDPYKKFQEDKGPLNQIRMRNSSNSIIDIANQSKIINAIQTFKFFRVYVKKDDTEAQKMINSLIEGEI